MMIDEMMNHPSLRGRDIPPTVGLMIVASFFRDEMPWLFELVVDLHRDYQSKDDRSITSAKQALTTAMELFGRHGFPFDPNGKEDDEFYFFMRHIPDIIESSLMPMRASETRKSVQKDDKGTN